MLFTHLADDLFRPLAAPSRVFNAALLLHLHATVFGDAAEPLRKADLIVAIGEFSGGWSQAEIADDETAPADPSSAAPTSTAGSWKPAGWWSGASATCPWWISTPRPGC